MTQHGTYTGEGPLHGETALLRQQEEGFFLAQFDNLYLPEAFGWHKFRAEDFVLNAPTQQEENQ